MSEGKKITDAKAKSLWNQCSHDWTQGAYTAMTAKLDERKDLPDE